jgi:lysophospholipase L1-like esterase
MLLALGALLLPAAASADLRVMCYGDAITAGDDGSPESSYPAQLQRLRPDLEVVNEGRRGDVSDNLDRFRKALTDWPPQLVVLMLGTNDATCDAADTPFCASSTATPEHSVANLFRMADEAREAGAAVVILTPPPAVDGESCRENHELEYATALRHAFTGRIADELLRARPPIGVRVADLRGRLTDASCEALSEGNRIIADFVAKRIPKRDTRRELHPFARRPQGHGARPRP